MLSWHGPFSLTTKHDVGQFGDTSRIHTLQHVFLTSSQSPHTRLKYFCGGSSTSSTSLYSTEIMSFSMRMRRRWPLSAIRDAAWLPLRHGVVLQPGRSLEIQLTGHSPTPHTWRWFVIALPCSHFCLKSSLPSTRRTYRCRPHCRLCIVLVDFLLNSGTGRQAVSLQQSSGSGPLASARPSAASTLVLGLF